MNITMLVLNNFVSDARVHKEAMTLTQSGHTVRVLALWQAGLPLQETRAGYQIQRLPLRSRALTGEPAAMLIKYIEFARAVRAATRSQPADVYHAHDANTLPAAWLAARADKAALVYDAHEFERGRNFGNFRLPGIYRRVWHLPEAAFIRRANAVITVSQAIADELAAYYQIAPPILVRNCPPRFNPPEPSGELRRQMRLNPTQPLLLYQGGLVAGRSLFTLLDVLTLLPKEIALVMLGEGSLRPQLQDRAQSLGLQERFYAPGAVPWEQLLTYTREADLGLCIIQNTCRSYYYSLPNKLFEYMMAEVPVLCSNFPEMQSVVLGADAGIAADPNNPHAIAEAIQILLAQPEKRRQMGQNGRRAALQTYNWETESQKLLRLYQNLHP